MSIPIPPNTPICDPPKVEPPKALQLEIPEILMKSFVSVATNAWKIRSRVIDPQTGDPKEDLKKDDVKKIARHLEAIFDAFAQVQLEVKDRTNEPFDYGLPEKVVATQPQPGLLKERIIETIRPSIIWGKNMVQQGEVVIATPETTNLQKKI